MMLLLSLARRIDYISIAFESDVSEMRDLTSSVQFVSDKPGESMRVMKDVKTGFAVLKKENEELHITNISVTNEVVKLNEKVKALQQYSRKNNIEISGLPVTPQENVVELVKGVGTGVRMAIDKVPKFRKDHHPHLPAQFVSRLTRENIIGKFREKTKMTAQDVNASFPKDSTYVNEHLFPDNKMNLAFHHHKKDHSTLFNSYRDAVT
ncbi:hypothetical protein J6590_048509 [Homalodisca vitripennis]|nr:hypothetical protein J6590_048509 [Homalodisca vitripennis]